MKELFKSLWNGIITLLKYIFILPFSLVFKLLKELVDDVVGWLILAIPFGIVCIIVYILCVITGY